MSMNDSWISNGEGKSFKELSVESTRHQEEFPCSKNFSPGLALVYNGKCLNINPELVHAALAGISIKHYYGKCELAPIIEEEEFFKDEPDEMYGFSLFGSQASVEKKSTERESSSESDGFEYREESLTNIESKPVCAQYRINFRNSFWNLHSPELSKLTWPQKYVSTATVTEHLHEHLMTHGTLCEKYHDEKDRIDLLNKELDEYGRLKVIVSPRTLPPDEKVFNFKQEEKFVPSSSETSKCVVYRSSMPKNVIDKKDRFLSVVSERDEVGIREVHRSKEEFCLTIGKPTKTWTLSLSVSASEEECPEMLFSPTIEEEGETFFYYNWPWFEEETFQEGSGTAFSTFSDMETNLVQPVNDCPPLMMDDFCRAAAKADFSDLRCNPDL